VTQTFEQLLQEHTGLLKLKTQQFLDRFGNDARLEFEDAYQIALLTLWKCSLGWDEHRPGSRKFSTYLGAALHRNLAKHARSTLPKVRCGKNSNSWRTVSVQSWDAMSARAQEAALLGYTVSAEDALQ
jgi:DNA-directed RNA polymerase specialized sigma24 family protein